MNDFTIVIPWRDSGCPFRKKHFDFLLKYYSSISKTIISDSNKEIFNRSEARNNGVKKCNSDIIMVVDADNYISKNQIEKSIDILKNKNSIIRPFNSIHYLNEEATERFYRSPKKFTVKENDHTYMIPEMISPYNSGGAYILKKQMWEKVGGMDEGFIGWGVEDSAFNIHSRHFFGDHIFIEGPNYNLYHPAERVVSIQSLDRYHQLYIKEKIFEEKRKS